jgi:tetratricopeptide (TPR) repeat protein
MNRHLTVATILFTAGASFGTVPYLRAADEPLDAAAYLKRGEASLEKRDYDQAIEYFTRALTVGPDFALGDRPGS